jgi:hypothetical protein
MVNIFISLEEGLFCLRLSFCGLTDLLNVKGHYRDRSEGYLSVWIKIKIHINFYSIANYQLVICIINL